MTCGYWVALLGNADMSPSVINRSQANVNEHAHVSTVASVVKSFQRGMQTVNVEGIQISPTSLLVLCRQRAAEEQETNAPPWQP